MTLRSMRVYVFVLYACIWGLVWVIQGCSDASSEVCVQYVRMCLNVGVHVGLWGII